MHRLIAALALLPAAPVLAGGLDDDDVGPRSIGRAGAVVVSDDGTGALLFSPAALARRSETRIRIGAAIRDRDIDYDALGPAPEVGDRSSPTASPSITAATSLGPVIVAGGYLEPRALSTRLPAPSFGQPTGDVEVLFPHRYSGTRLGLRARELRVGAAVRATDWLAVGASAGARWTLVDEERTIWPGFSGRDGLANPSRDLGVRMNADDALSASAAVGIFVAPLQLPIEAAVAAQLVQGASASGDIALSARQPTSPASSGGGAASLALPAHLIVSGGLRFVQTRFSVEVAAIHRIYRGDGSPLVWRIDGVTITDDSGVMAELDALPSQLSFRDHTALAAAVEGELVSGFLWLTAGYRFQTAAMRQEYLSPALTDLGGNTLAFGARVYVSGITATVGYARSTTTDIRREGGATTLDNPLGGGTQVIGDGQYDRADDRVGLSIEVAWEEPLPDLPL